MESSLKNDLSALETETFEIQDTTELALDQPAWSSCSTSSCCGCSSCSCSSTSCSSTSSTSTTSCSG
ncbi:hypothetical protein LX16_1082 [Stackebrandtia albiflava]|uniref:Thiazolylpeptide-type bacteriocin n=1 Tax=Stackebrandtia albiflava TaxID=406432 RepID=A0A562VBX8_9ACTN|nr:hypothetical protein LX16_1082 [Stackebrandtia albiflava]